VRVEVPGDQLCSLNGVSAPVERSQPAVRVVARDDTVHGGERRFYPRNPKSVALQSEKRQFVDRVEEAEGV